MWTPLSSVQVWLDQLHNQGYRWRDGRRQDGEMTAYTCELLAGPTFEVSDTEVRGRLAQLRCWNPDQCEREFLEYGVTKFFSGESERGVRYESTTLRRVGG